MPPEKPARFGKMTSRQIMIAIILVIVLAVIIWQIMGLLGNSGGFSSTPPTPTPPAMQPAKPITTNAPVSQPNNISVSAIPAPPAAALMRAPAPAQSALREAPIPMDAQILDLQKKSEQKYIDQLNQLQMLKIQREIAETNQAIASARLATVTAEKNVSDLLTKPSTPQANAAALYAATQAAGVATPPLPAPPEGVPPSPPEAAYLVISVSMQLGRWNAVLSYQGKLFSVSIGDVLPVDGSVVACINKNGVILIKEGKRRRVGMVSAL